MKLTCGACGKMLGYRCPFCREPLQKTRLNGVTWYRCANEETPIYFDPLRMKETQGTCADCAHNAANAAQQAQQRQRENRANLHAQTHPQPTRPGP